MLAVGKAFKIFNRVIIVVFVFVVNMMASGDGPVLCPPYSPMVGISKVSFLDWIPSHRFKIPVSWRPLMPRPFERLAIVDTSLKLFVLKFFVSFVCHRA